MLLLVVKLFRNSALSLGVTRPSQIAHDLLYDDDRDADKAAQLDDPQTCVNKKIGVHLRPSPCENEAKTLNHKDVTVSCNYCNC